MVALTWTNSMYIYYSSPAIRPLLPCAPSNPMQVEFTEGSEFHMCDVLLACVYITRLTHMFGYPESRDDGKRGRW